MAELSSHSAGILLRGKAFHTHTKGFLSALNVLKFVYLYLFPLELLLSGKLSEYGVIVPFSADCQGRFLSHVVSGSVAGSRAEADHPSAPPPHSDRHRVIRSTRLNQGVPRNRLYYFNVTVFGEELHLRLKPNRRLVSPDALTEWQEDFQEVFQEPLQQECVFTGGVSGMPGATVALSNCDGLVSQMKWHPLGGVIECFCFLLFKAVEWCLCYVLCYVWKYLRKHKAARSSANSSALIQLA